MRYDATTTNAIEATGLVKRFGQTTALAGVDLVARQGSVLGVLGPNGGLLRVAFGQHAMALDGESLEGHRVDGVRRHRQPVPGRARLDNVIEPGPPQFGPQPGHQCLQGIAGVAGRFAGPDLFGQ